MCVFDAVLLNQAGECFAMWIAARSALAAKLRLRKHYVRRYGPVGLGRPRYAVRVLTPAEYTRGRASEEG